MGDDKRLQSPDHALKGYFDDLLGGSEDITERSFEPQPVPSSTPQAKPFAEPQPQTSSAAQAHRERLERLLASARAQLTEAAPESAINTPQVQVAEVKVEVAEVKVEVAEVKPSPRLRTIPAPVVTPVIATPEPDVVTKPTPVPTLTPVPAPEIVTQVEEEEISAVIEPELAESVADELEASLAWAENGRPRWAQERFEVLLFEVGGLNLAVPLIALGQITPLSDDLTPLFGQAKWFMGLQPTPMGQIRTVNTALFVMPERYDETLLASAKYVVSIDGMPWGLAVDKVHQPISLMPEDVRWRTERSKRPWLAGTVKEHMCALIDIPRMGQLLQHSDANRHKGASSH